MKLIYPVLSPVGQCNSTALHLELLENCDNPSSAASVEWLSVQHLLNPPDAKTNQRLVEQSSVTEFLSRAVFYFF